MENKKSKKGFTLVEALLTLVVIGVIVAILAPPFTKQWKQRRYENAKKVFIANLKSAVRNMQADDKYPGFNNTESFVRELEKYMRLEKVCYGSGSGDGINNCFSEEFIDGEGMTYEECYTYGSGSNAYTSCYTYAMANYASGAESYSYYSLNYSYDLFRKRYESRNVGIVTPNGVNAVLSYDPECSSSDDMFSDQKALSCITAIYDLNGFKGPNNTTEDIGFLNFTSWKSEKEEYVCEGVQVGDLCWITNDLQQGATASVYGYYSSSTGMGYRLPTAKELKDFLAANGSQFSSNQCFQSSITNNVTYTDYNTFYNNPQDYYMFVMADGTVVPSGRDCDQQRLYVADPDY